MHTALDTWCFYSSGSCGHFTCDSACCYTSYVDWSCTQNYLHQFFCNQSPFADSPKHLKASYIFFLFYSHGILIYTLLLSCFPQACQITDMSQNNLFCVRLHSVLKQKFLTCFYWTSLTASFSFILFMKCMKWTNNREIIYISLTTCICHS